MSGAIRVYRSHNNFEHFDMLIISYCVIYLAYTLTMRTEEKVTIASNMRVTQAIRPLCISVKSPHISQPSASVDK